VFLTDITSLIFLLKLMCDMSCDVFNFFILSRGELGRFWKYSNFRQRLILLLFWRPPVACYGEAAIVKTARHVCA